MKIAILTSGILPVPAVQGGAVENLIDFYLEYNDRLRLHDITVYSVWHPDVEKHPALKSEVNRYKYINGKTLFAKIWKLYFIWKKKNGYYHRSIEYYLYKSTRHIVKQNYDVIIIENRPAYSLYLANRTKATFVYHLHNEKLDCDTLEGTPIYDAADRIICVSDYITNCVRTIKDNDKKCITVHNGIDLNIFSPKKIISKKHFGLKEDDFILIYSGRINKEKGILELIKAMNLLKKYENIKLFVVGSSFYGNSNTETSFTKTLKEEASSLKNCIIFTGFIPYEEMPNYLSISDIAVIPSNWDDPFPTTVLEAQAMGLPIITTRRGGIPEEVTDKNAIILNTDQHFIDNLAKAILDLYQHSEKRKQMAAASLQRSKLFDKETYARNFFKALELGTLTAQQ